MKFYLYPFTNIPHKIKWSYDKFFFNRWIKESILALTHNELRVDNPEDADFFIVSFTLMFLSFVSFNKNRVENELKKLKYWNNGHNHIVFDLTDLPHTFYDNKNLIVFKSAFSNKNYRKTKHVSIPQFPRYSFNEQFLKKYCYEKNKLVCFKGNPRTGKNFIRDKLFLMNDNKNFFIKEFNNDPNDFEFNIVNNVMRINVSDDEFSYLNLLFKSRFCLLPRGNGWALSYRHIESMNAGCIPVIISDCYQLPFSEKIDWNSCSIKIKEDELDNILDIIKNNLYREEELRKNIKKVFENYFSTTKKIIDTAIDIYVDKFRLKV